ncbi:FUSC family protein [Asticcacaulis sp. AND118]|uniref:FUSC family protein n=1 Tax=Asticcacaulis sp. AND118 TaxID=2840468 RepID=UPI001CFFCF26|nr:FUSC family protein [Asticcacaulis sp. AND118]UDF02512.1 FUSC family protein [Asticcacaulis sp. AND118]
MTARIGALWQWLEIDRGGVHQALRLAFAAWLAFAIASMLHVEHAYWAAMPVWVVSQPSRGLLLERAFFRILGTLIGAGAGFAILFLAAGPLAGIVFLALWVAVNAGLTHILRGVHGYGALMAGMTAAIVVLPSLLTPQSAYEVAEARVICTLIGVAVVTLVTGFFTPVSPRDELYRRVKLISQEAVSFAAEAIAVPEAPDSPDTERRILADISDVEASAALISAGSVEGYRRLRHLDALIAATLAVMAAGRAVRARRRRGDAVPEGLAEHLNDAEWLHALPKSQLIPEVDRLIDALAQLTEAERRLFALSSKADAESFGHKAIYLAPNRDRSMALRTALVAGGATLVAVGLAWWSKWPLAELTAMGVCIFSMVLGQMAKPQVIAPELLKGMVCGVAVAILYRLFLQPHLQGPLAVHLSLIPFLLIGGLARVSPKTTLPALEGNMGFLLTSQAGAAAIPVDHVLLSSLAFLVGMGSVCAGFIVYPPKAVDHAADAASRIRRDLERMVRREGPVHPRQWRPHTSRQILRLMLHLGRAGKLGQDAPDGLLAALNLGHAITRLQRLAAHPQAREGATLVLHRLEGFADHTAQTVAELRHLRLADAAVERALVNTADALEAAAPVFKFGHAAD